MRSPLPRIILTACTAALVGLAVGQTYKLKSVGPAEGLTNPFVHALAQDATGRLWIGTGDGAGRYDGQRVTMFTTADSLAENFVSTIHPGADGKIWFGHSEGGISIYENGVFRKVRTEEHSNSSINAIVDDGQGGIWAVAQNKGILHVDAHDECRVVVAKTHIQWYSLLVLNANSLLAGTSDGLHLLQREKSGSFSISPVLSEVTTAPVHSLLMEENGERIHAGTEGAGVMTFGLKDGRISNVAQLGTAAGLGELRIRDMQIGTYGQLILGTFGNGAYEIELQGDSITALLHYSQENGLGTDNVSVVLPDSENNLWFGRFGMGLARLLDRAVVYYAADGAAAQDVRAITFSGNDIWFSITGKILHANSNDMRHMDTLGVANGLPDVEISALATDTSGRILAGTANNGLYRQDGNGRFMPVAIGNDLMSRKIHAIVVKGDEIWVGTSYGVYLLSPRGNRHLTTANGLLHNEVNALYLEANGHIWAACNNGGVSVISGDDVKSFTLTEQGNSVHVTGITQDSLGTLWFSTNGNGVRYIKGGVVLGVSKADGLHSDYVQAIASDGQGGIWAAHRGGASRVDRDDQSVLAFADQFGIEPDRRMNAIAKGPYGHMWFATDKGLLRYTSMKDVHSVRTPTAIITGVKVSGRDMPPDRSIDLPPDIYRIQFDFLGISLANPDGVRYRYKLEGYDLDWTETTLGSAHYMRISEGNYTLQVQAAMIGGDFTGNTARLAITVQTPVWKRHWFITLCVIALLAAISGFIRLRERRQRKNRELLKKSLKERTKELQAKSDELEEKNKDITDSITYARRIQQAILPQEDILAEHFPNSFIFYRPRDIVSGDFYWFRRFGTKFILACADCTGHGVPGAFMSMIGSMLLREVSAEKEVNSPDVLLTNLDNELRAVLRYQGENQYNHDGMDISLCEIDMETRLLRSSAAMHDLLILRNGKLLRERGTRRSIGGVMEEGVEQHFNRFEIPLEPGDRIFLFTDGMPDQFGGARGKKLKISGLTEWIEETAPLPMDEQASLLRFRFEEWIGEQAQVDDVLLIGIEV